MREVVLDTETTGFEPEDGHRIVEIGAVELWNHVPTGRTYHEYLDPERPMPDDAYAVHGLGDAFLRGQPVFADIAEAFHAFAGDAVLVIHNAAFDMKFLDAELGRAGHACLGADRALDTLALARKAFPGAPVSLDALCRRFGIDNASRTKHGALLDSELLAEVYLELIGGRQPGFTLAPAMTGTREAHGEQSGYPPRPTTLAARLSDEESAAHRAFVARLGNDPLWTQLD